MTSQELCEQYQAEYIRHAMIYRKDLKIKTIPYPKIGWQRLMTPSQVLNVLQHDPRYYKPCTPDQYQNTDEDVLIALSGVTLIWTEHYYCHNYMTKKGEVSEPYIIWINTGSPAGGKYRIYRRHYSHGEYLPFTEAHLWPHDVQGVNSLEDAKKVCLLHYIGSQPNS